MLDLKSVPPVLSGTINWRFGPGYGRPRNVRKAVTIIIKVIVILVYRLPCSMIQCSYFHIYYRGSRRGWRESRPPRKKEQKLSVVYRRTLFCKDAAMGKVRRRQGHDVRFGDHARQYSALREHDVPQVLIYNKNHVCLAVGTNDAAVKSRAYQFAEHVHDELQWNLFP